MQRLGHGNVCSIAIHFQRRQFLSALPVAVIILGEDTVTDRYRRRYTTALLACDPDLSI